MIEIEGSKIKFHLCTNREVVLQRKASSIYWNREYWNMELGTVRTGERKSLKKGTSQWHFLSQWRLHQWKGLPSYNPHTKLLGSLSVQNSPNQGFIRTWISRAV